ncbi:hypothetical protein TWF730_001079 [Orbilia blumenaviensis]|uniref:Uncharacterized protein n=1 Tax=Orbilia blumenaviensis TaxID=1796055 RepID=A0AAV9VNP3_9PEZI
MQFPASKSAVLHRNVAHRAACLALYRRLLKHAQNTTSSPLLTPPLTPPQLQQSLKSIITREFKNYRSRTPLIQIRAALTFGQKAERCLRLATASSPDPIELARLSAFLNLHRQKRSNKDDSKKPLVRLQAANITVQPSPKPKTTKPVPPNILQLPFDLRFKPTIIGGNTIPFVRYTGTKQSPELSGILNKKLKQKLKRDDLLESLRLEREYADAEDVFENEVWNQAGREWRKENPELSPANDGQYKTELVKAQMDLQLKMWAHQVSVWERSGECMDRIEDHKRRVKEFMDNLKAERMKEKGLVPKVEAVEGDKAKQAPERIRKSAVDTLDSTQTSDSSAAEPRVETGAREAVDAQMDALNAQLEAAGLKPEPQTPEPKKTPRSESKKQERGRPLLNFGSIDPQMDALNAQLEAAGFKPTSRTTKPPKHNNRNTPRNPQTSRQKSRQPSNNNNKTNDNKPNKPHQNLKEFRGTPRPKRLPSPGRREDGRPSRQELRKENFIPEQHGDGAMLAGKGKRSRIGLDIAKVFGAEEPGSRAVKRKENAAAKSRPYAKALDDIFDDSWANDGRSA